MDTPELSYVIPEGVTPGEAFIIRQQFDILRRLRTVDGKIDRLAQVLECDALIAPGQGSYIRDDLLNEKTV